LAVRQHVHEPLLHPVRPSVLLALPGRVPERVFPRVPGLSHLASLGTSSEGFPPAQGETGLRIFGWHAFLNRKYL